MRALEGHCVSSKSPSRDRDRDKGVAGRTEEKSIFQKRVFVNDFFTKKETEKNELVARPSVEGHKKVRDRGNGLDPAWKVVAVALDHLRQKVEVPKLVEVDQKPETTIRKV